jgi:hypothetical protein
MGDGRNNDLLKGLALGFSILLLAWLFADLLDSKSGEQAGALGAVVGGIIGAGGAILAVYLTLSRQRREDTATVRAAIRTELTTYAKYVIGALEICQSIAVGQRSGSVPMANATYITKNLVEPVIYPAVADRIVLVQRPQATIEFYMRVQEAKAMTEGMAASVSTLSPAQSAMNTIQASHAESVADTLVTALQLVRPIIADSGDSLSEFDVWIRDTVLRQIDAALQSAQGSFPNAESFNNPPPDGEQVSAGSGAAR